MAFAGAQTSLTGTKKKPPAPTYDPHDPRSGGMVTDVYTAPGTPAPVAGSQAGTYVSYDGGNTSTTPTPAAPPAATTAPGTGTGGLSAPTGPTDPQKNARDIVNDTLAQYGLSSLADWAWNEILAGSSPSQVLLDLQNQQAFKDAFPEIAMQQAKGLAPMSPGQIINYRTDAMQRMQAAGLPKDFWDSPKDFANMIGNEMSTDELQQRIDLARQATYNMPQEVRDHLARDYGITDGHLAAQFLDPAQAEPLLAKQFLASQIGAAADTTGYGATSRTQNERLADLGVTQAQAQQGFNQLANSRQLFTALPGENTTGISQEDQLAAVFGQNADAQRKITARADQRKAQFAGGGGFASGAGGNTGVGSAQGA